MYTTRVLWRAFFLVGLYILSSQQACYADWRDTLIQAVAPRVVDRTMNYLLGKRNTLAPKAVHQARSTGNSSSASRTGVPAPLAVSHSPAAQKQEKSVYVPPPPPQQQLVPPPPPSVPYGAVLGLYPDSMNNDVTLPTIKQRPGDPPPPHIVATQTAPAVSQSSAPGAASKQVETMPAAAPDFRHSGAK